MTSVRDGIRVLRLAAALAAVVVPARASGFLSLQNANNIDLLQLATSGTGITNSGTTTGSEIVNEGINTGGGTISVAGTGATKTLTGSVYYGAAANPVSGCAQVSGACVQDLSDLGATGTLVSNAQNDYTMATGLATTVTETDATFSRTISATGDVTVATFAGTVGINYGTGTHTLTLNGSATDVFILQINGTLDLDSTSSIALSGGLLASNVLIVFTGTTAQTITLSGSTVNGNLLVDDPNYTLSLSGTALDHGVVNGVVVADNTVTMSNFTINGGVDAFSGPEPGTWVMLLGGLAAIVTVQLRRKSAKPSQQS